MANSDATPQNVADMATDQITLPNEAMLIGTFGPEAAKRLGDGFDGAMREISRIAYDYFSRKGRATRYGTYVDPDLIR